MQTNLERGRYIVCQKLIVNKQDVNKNSFFAILIEHFCL